MKDTKCILPFIHLYSEPRGDVRACCIASSFEPKVNLKDMTIEEAFNSTQMKELRKDMLEGKRNKVCDVCYKKEDLNGHSPRLDFNSNQLWEIPKVEEDFSVKSDIQHIDIRFSNLCNFACRMCSHEFSSHWYETTKTINPSATKHTPKVLKIKDGIVDELIPHLKIIKSAYFAGGEPLIMPEHFQLLNWLYDNVEVDEETNKRKLSIHYNTNLSVIKYNEEDLVKLWRGFNRVFLSISCDGIGEVGEYQRVGFKHDKFIKNLKIIQKYFTPEEVSVPIHGLFYNFQYTTTIYNVYHIFDFISFMKDNNFITDESQIDFYHSWLPKSTSLNNLDESEKIRVLDFLNENLENISSEKTKREIQNIINFISSDSNIKGIDSNIVLYQYTKELDEIHNTDIEKINGVKLKI